MLNNYSLAGIHLPDNKNLNSKLRVLSVVLAILIIILVLITFLGWKGSMSLGLAIAFLSAGVSLVSEYQFFRLDSNLIQKRKIYSSISIVCGVIVLICGISQFANPIVGMCLLLSGSWLILPHTKLLHIYHTVHFLIFVVLIVSSTILLRYAYGLIFPLNSSFINMPVNSAILFFLLCASSALRWPARGFIGMFTTDTLSSMFALRLLIISVITTTILGFLSLLGVLLGIYNKHEAVAVFAMSQIALSTILAWLNAKLIYKLELERFLILEELKIHSIDLQMGNEELTVKMKGLDKTNKEYLDKLNNQEKFGDVIDSLS